MLNYARTEGCRHRHLVEISTSLISARAAERDICESLHAVVASPDSRHWVDDPLKLAQMILCCVIRLGERFGQSHVAKVLKGSQDKTVLQYKHDQLSTYGLMNDQTLPIIGELHPAIGAAEVPRFCGRVPHAIGHARRSAGDSRSHHSPAPPRQR
ncbi:MAG: hypothetical protein IPK53_18060 [bacterium]|nr:hypothetical protein [bacterium]